MKLELVESEGISLDHAERALAALEAERDAMPAALEVAASAADAGRLQALRRRSGELADEIFGARARVVRLRLVEEEARHAKLTAELRELDQRLTVATREAQRLQDQANAALERRGAIMIRVMAAEALAQNSHEEILELRAELGNLVAKASGGEERREQFGLGGSKTFPREAA